MGRAFPGTIVDSVRQTSNHPENTKKSPSLMFINAARYNDNLTIIELAVCVATDS